MGTWNVRTLRAAGKPKELTHEMDRYHYNILGLCEMLRKNFGVSSDDRHKVYFSGEKDKHEYGVCFLLHKDMAGAVLGCRAVSSRLILIRLRAAPFNVTIEPPSGYDDNEVNHFYRKLHEILTKHLRRTFWL